MINDVSVYHLNYYKNIYIIYQVLSSYMYVVHKQSEYVLSPWIDQPKMFGFKSRALQLKMGDVANCLSGDKCSNQIRPSGFI